MIVGLLASLNLADLDKIQPAEWAKTLGMDEGDIRFAIERRRRDIIDLECLRNRPEGEE